MAVELHVTGFDLGQVQDVVDDDQQGLTRIGNVAGKSALFGVQWGVQQQVGHAQHTVHGGTDLVRHIGQKLALGLARLLRLAGFNLQVAVQRFAAQLRTRQLVEQEDGQHADQRRGQLHRAHIGGHRGQCGAARFGHQVGQTKFGVVVVAVNLVCAQARGPQAEIAAAGVLRGGHRQGAKGLADDVGVLRVARHDLAAGAHDEHLALVGQPQGGGEVGKQGRADRDHQHAIEAFATPDRARELDRPFARDLALDRHADVELVLVRVLAVDAKVRARAQIHVLVRLGQIGKRQDPLGIDDRDLEGEVLDAFLRLLDEGGKRRRVAAPVAAEVEQDLVDALDRRARVFAEDTRLHARLQRRRVQCTAAAALDFIPGRDPDDAQAEQQQERDAPAHGRGKQAFHGR